MNGNKLTLESLPASERSVVEQTYGKQSASYHPYEIDSLWELSAEESVFFGRHKFISPHFFRQTLYKVTGVVSTMRFNMAINKSTRENEALRTNYCPVGERVLKVVLKERPGLPDVVYRNIDNLDGDSLDTTLKNIMEADRRKDLDLRHGALVRFTVLRTDAEEYAILMTVAQLIAHNFDGRRLLKDAFGRDVLSTETKKSAKRMFTFAPIAANIKSYWQEVLQDLPKPPQLPYHRDYVAKGTFEQSAYRLVIPEDISSDLLGRAKSNRLMLMAILATAWGFMLENGSGSRDVALALLTPAKTGGNFNLMPVRQKAAGSLSVAKLVNQQFQQLVISQPYSVFAWEGLQELTGSSRLPDHFLSFSEFLTEEKPYSKVKATEEGEIVSQFAWDSQGMNLGVYFHHHATSIVLSLLYNKSQFLPDGGRLLGKRYGIVLKQMLTDWDAPFYKFDERLTSRLTAEQESGHLSAEDESQLIRNFIMQNDILNGDSAGSVNTFADVFSIITRFEGDRLSGEEIEENLFFVMSGKLARSIDTGDGWYNTVNIIKKNDLLNVVALSEESRVKISAEVLTAEAVLMKIPLKTMLSICMKYPGISLQIARYALGQMEKYQRLWLQS